MGYTQTNLILIAAYHPVRKAHFAISKQFRLTWRNEFDQKL